jgi:hypothetical protein
MPFNSLHYRESEPTPMTMPDIDELTGMSVQDAALWRGTRTLADLGELTARWL